MAEEVSKMHRPPPRGSTPSAAELAELVYGPSTQGPDPEPAARPTLKDRIRAAIVWAPAANRAVALIAAATAVVLTAGAFRGWWHPSQHLSWAAAVAAATSVLAEQAAALVLRLRARRGARRG